MSRKICVVTGSRAEYGLLYPILKEIEQYDGLDLQLVATTMHLSDEFGLTYQQIEKDGFKIDEKIDNLSKVDSNSSMAKSSGMAIILLAECFEKLSPDIVLLLGDRFETHAAATTALLMNIPIAHIHGGEIAQGSVDEQLRHAITKMSYLHFCSTNVYRQRIIQMGEDASKVFNFGAPGIDNIVNMNLLTRNDLNTQLDWKLPENFSLFTYHSTTLEFNDINQELDSIFDILIEVGIGVLFTYANADFGGKIINNRIEDFCKLDANKYKVVKSLGQLRYLSVMKHANLLIGNTSSGIIEAASFYKPVVNIGNRQLGRLRGVNVIDCMIQELHQSIILAMSNDFIIKCLNQQNIYGNGNTSKRIVRELINQPLSVVKKFIDIK
jgi:GDP/UDP-N,N'-diacetylbacillosamine 2-epimerase (hydrolysing)